MTGTRIAVLLLAAVCQTCLAAPYLDLLTAGSYGQLGGAWWVTAKTGSGTGNFEPFLQVNDDNDAGFAETGYNSDYQSTNEDNPEAGPSANWNHLVQWPQISMLQDPIVGGLTRYGWWVELQLDINENSGGAGGINDAYLSVGDMEVWLSDRADLGNPANSDLYYANWGDETTYPSLYAHTSKIYDSSAYGWIATDYRQYSSGSGAADIQVLIPWRDFVWWIVPEGIRYPYIYVKTTMGSVTETYNGITNWTVSDGFEEWGYRDPFTYNDDLPPYIPEPGSATLMGFGLLTLVAIRRRKR